MPAQGKKDLVDIGELVRVEERQAYVGESADMCVAIGRLQVGDEVGVSVQFLGKGELLAGVFFDGVTSHFERRLRCDRRGLAQQRFDVAPVSEAGLQFVPELVGVSRPARNSVRWLARRSECPLSRDSREPALVHAWTAH